MHVTGHDLRIDIGCGSCKKEGTLGVNFVPGPGIDYVVDLQKSPLPFADWSVAYVHTSHFLEHVDNPLDNLIEMSRVCRHGGQIEIWTPYAWSNDAFIFSHKNFLN